MTRYRRVVRRLLVLSVLLTALVVAGCGGDEDGREAEPTSTTVEGCVETVRGCIDPDSIAPGECVPSTPESEDCVNFRPAEDDTADSDG